MQLDSMFLLHMKGSDERDDQNKDDDHDEEEEEEEVHHPEQVSTEKDLDTSGHNLLNHASSREN